MHSWAESPAIVASLTLNNEDLALPTEVEELMVETILGFRTRFEAWFSRSLPSFKRLSSTMDGASMLRLATAVFMNTPKAPTSFIGMPFHLLHRMQTHLPRVTESPASSSDQYWVYDKVSAAIIKDIVSLCGLNPDTCTHAQLEETDPYVDCLTCTDLKVPRMKWNQAVSSIFTSRKPLDISQF